MKFQLHWQHRLDGRCIFVDQGEAQTADQMEALVERFNQTIKDRASECPEDFSPMICDEASEYFDPAPIVVTGNAEN